MNNNEKSVPPFRGVGTALITPFSGGEIDLECFRRQIDFQIAGGADALVVCGTTGEAATLTDKEKHRLLEAAVKRADGKLPVIAGTGSQSTLLACEAARAAAESGANGLLIVTPYYNKGTRDGVVAHFLKIAESSELPIILYNVPTRTGVNLSVEQIRTLAAHPHIVGIKEASGDIEKSADIAAALGDAFALYSGNDSQLLPILSLGGIGIISVLSNLFPRECRSLIRLFEDGKVKAAAELQRRFLPITRLLFRETNPSPLKYAMSQLSRDSGELRLPLAQVPRELGREIEEALADLGAFLTH